MRPWLGVLIASAVLVGSACTAPASPSASAFPSAPASPSAPAAPGSAQVPGATTSRAAGGTGGPIAVTDALGRQVTFPAAPRRIVIAGKTDFVIADAAFLFPEARSRVVAIGRPGQNWLRFLPVIDPQSAQITILDTGAGPEQIAASHPDAVLMTSSNARTLGGPLAALGVPVVYVDFETPSDYTRDLGILGTVFTDPARAQQLVAFFQGQVARVTGPLAGLGESQKPSILLLYYNDANGAVSFNVPPLSFIQSSEAQLAGGRLAWKDAELGQGWTTVSFEQIAAWNPDQIYLIAYFNSATEVVRSLKANPQWAALHAVQQGQIYAFPGDYISWDEPDPRWVLGLTWLATKMHPDAFTGLDMTAEIRTFYRDLYGLDAAAYASQIAPRLTGDLP
ncbi:MAG: ABC transporter substrate-binding protein [Candidatus Limnocylindrales bacterium]